MYEIFEHTADFGLRIEAPSLPELFAESGRALIGSMLEDASGLEPRERFEVSLPAAPVDDLLHDWLTELLFLFHTRRVAFCRFHVSLNKDSLTAEVFGEPINPARHLVLVEVKAITYHGLKVEQRADGWRAEVIVDI